MFISNVFLSAPPAPVHAVDGEAGLPDPRLQDQRGEPGEPAATANSRTSRLSGSSHTKVAQS